jgi:hypothetical protein
MLNYYYISQQDTTTSQFQEQHSKPVVVTGSKKTTPLATPGTKPALQRSSATLTHADSVKLNLIQKHPANTDYFYDNMLTRRLHPEQVLTPPDQIKSLTASQSLSAVDDTIRQDTVDINQAQITLQPLEVVTEKRIAGDEKSLPVNAFVPQQIWLVPSLLVLAALLGIIRLSSGKYINSLFSSVFYKQSTVKLSTYKGSVPSVLLNLLFLFNLSFFAYLTLTYFQLTPLGQKGPLLLLILWIILSMVAFVKSAAYKLIGLIFNTRKETSEFLFNVHAINKVFGMSILPIIAVLPFFHGASGLILIQMGAALFFAMYLLQLYKGAKIILQHPLSIFYMILYLCALEILPLSILYKVLVLRV